MALCVGGCLPAKTDKFLLAGAYANRQHRGFLCSRLLRTPTITMLFVLAVLYAARRHKGFSPFCYIIPHNRLLSVYNSPFSFIICIWPEYLMYFLIFISVSQIHMNLLLFVSKRQIQICPSTTHNPN
jgi:hypothetical protein